MEKREHVFRIFHSPLPTPAPVLGEGVMTVMVMMLITANTAEMWYLPNYFTSISSKKSQLYSVLVITAFASPGNED